MRDLHKPPPKRLQSAYNFFKVTSIIFYMGSKIKRVKITIPDFFLVESSRIKLDKDLSMSENAKRKKTK